MTRLSRENPSNVVSGKIQLSALSSPLFAKFIFIQYVISQSVLANFVCLVIFARLLGYALELFAGVVLVTLPRGATRIKIAASDNSPEHDARGR